MSWFRKKDPPEPARPPQAPPAAPPPTEEEAFRLVEVAEYEPTARRLPSPASYPELPSWLTRVRAAFASLSQDLPAFPALALQITELLRDPEVNISRVLQLITREPAVSASVIRLANSAFYAKTSRVQTVREAVVRIGLNEARTVAGAVASASLFNPDVQAQQSMYPHVWSKLWRHSLVSAMAGSTAALQRDQGDPTRLFLGGLLHDIGKVFALRAVCSLCAQDELPIMDDEGLELVLEQLHVELGAHVARTWNLPDFVAQACAEHHQDELTLNDANSELHLLRLISGVNEVRVNPLFRATLPAELDISIRALRLRPKQIRSLVTEVRQSATKADALLDQTLA